MWSVLFALADAHPAHIAGAEKVQTGEVKRPAVLLNLFLGGGEDRQIPVIGGQVREVGKPVRLAGEAIRQISESGSGE